MLHVPVMAQEVLENLPKKLDLMMDGTLGHGWHSRLILSNFDNVKIIWVDRDPKILEIAKQNLKDYENRVKFVQNSYKNLEKILWETKVDAILLDLWVNMEHFKDPKRWFSIKYDGPLDMRFDPSNKITAEWILKNYTPEQLEKILSKWWDFKWKLLNEIVKAIVSNRWKLNSTFALKDLLKRIWLSEKKIAVVFQVLRIETNKELEQLEVFLQKFQDYLTPWWRCLIITYHSIEDRLVKNRFKELDWQWFKNLTKKVIFPTWAEIQRNKASRSAKLRLIEKLDS